MERFAVIEVNSNHAKGYVYQNGKIEELPHVTILFKQNYEKYGKLIEEDKEKLYQYITTIKEQFPYIEVYGTGIFRKVNEEEKKKFFVEFFSKTFVNFNIISTEEENELTVYGTIAKMKHHNKTAIMLGGKNATELIIVEQGNIIEKCKFSFGAGNILEWFPDLKEDVVKSNYQQMLTKVIEKLEPLPKNEAELLVLAGGNYLMFYETLQYPLKENIFFQDSNQPYYLEKNNMEEADLQYFYHTSLQKIKKENGHVKVWWDGTRGVRLCVHAIADKIHADFIIPSKVTMVYGIIEKLKKKK